MSLDLIMESASDALARMDYLTCESLCEQALALARAGDNWAYSGRILLPLQEARRQRRMIAAEATIRLGTANLAGDPENWLSQLEAGCVVVTHPHGRQEAARLHQAARKQRLWIEVLFADSRTDEAMWTVRTFTGPDVSCRMTAPRPEWRNVWLARETKPVGTKKSSLSPGATPGDWFLDAAEKLGDAMMAAADAGPPRQRIEALEQCLLALPSHELLHQRLGDAVRAACLIHEPATA